MAPDEALMRRYSVRRKPGGSRTFGDAWEVLFDGKRWIDAPEGMLPITGREAGTKRKAMRRARRIARAVGEAPTRVVFSEGDRIPMRDARV